MRISLQHSLEQIQDWVHLDHTEWPAYVAQIKRTLPQGGEALNSLGYLNSLSVMGLYGDGDHYAIEPYGIGGVKMSLWYDHAEDLLLPQYNSIGPGARAIVWTFEPMREIAEKGNMWQPKLTRTLYGSREYLDAVEAKEGFPITCSLNQTVHKLYSNFPKPVDAITLHGIWMAKGLHDEHQTARTPQSWREWTDGVPAELCVDGKLVAQRSIGRYVIPDGTITWFLLDADVANGIHAANNEDGMDQTDPASLVGESGANISAGNDSEDFVWSSPVGEPGTDTWPTGNYRAQIDVSATGANLTFGVRDLGGSSGHFARVNTGLTADQTTHQQTEDAFAGIAAHLATTGSVSWGTPATSDRWEVLWATIRAAGTHGNQSITVDLDHADSFTDGPWSVGLDLVKIEDEVVNVDENVNKTKLIAKSIPEVENIQDDVNKTRLIAKSIPEIENIQEDAQKTIGLIRVEDEAENVQEDINKTKLIAKVLDEVENVVEDVVKSMEQVRVLDETEDIAEAINKTKLIAQIEDEVLNIQEAVQKVIGIIRVEDEAVNIAEAVNKTKLIAKSQAEVMNLVEHIVKSQIIVRATDEAENINEGLVRLLDIVQVASEVENIQEGIVKLVESTGAALLKIIDETVNVPEDIVKLVEILKVLAERISVVEFPLSARVMVRLKSEFKRIREVEGRFSVTALNLRRFENSAVNVPETTGKTKAIFKILSEVVNLVEGLVNTLAKTVLASEVVNASESIVKSMALIRLRKEWAQWVEKVVKIQAIVRGLTAEVMNVVEVALDQITTPALSAGLGQGDSQATTDGTVSIEGGGFGVATLVPVALGTVEIRAV